MFKSMRRFSVVLLLAGICGLPQARAQTAQEILSASDKIRNPGVPFRVQQALTEYRSGQAHESASLLTYSKLATETGQYRNIARYIAPARDAGKALLMKDTVMWFYDPASKTSVRISPQQRLIGQASNGDVLSVNLNKDYTATLVAEETIKDADKAPRNTWHLLLNASSPSALYLKIDYWVEKGTHYPVKAKFFADSGRLLKTAFYRAYGRQLGGMRPTEIIILDEVDATVATRMRFSKYEAADIPERWFQRDFLPSLPSN